MACFVRFDFGVFGFIHTISHMQISEAEAREGGGGERGGSGQLGGQGGPGLELAGPREAAEGGGGAGRRRVEGRCCLHPRRRRRRGEQLQQRDQFDHVEWRRRRAQKQKAAL